MKLILCKSCRVISLRWVAQQTNRLTTTVEYRQKNEKKTFKAPGKHKHRPRPWLVFPILYLEMADLMDKTGVDFHGLWLTRVGGSQVGNMSKTSLLFPTPDLPKKSISGDYGKWPSARVLERG